MLAGLVLAGGKSSRMGTDKSVLILPETQQSLLAHAQHKLTQVCDSPVLISGVQHQKGIADLVPDCGPLSGIHAAIRHLQSQDSRIKELLVTAVDMPDVSNLDLNHLLKIGRKNSSLCCYQNHVLPLYMLLTKELIDYLDTVLIQDSIATATLVKPRKYSLNTMFETLQGMQIPPLEDTQLNNINTPEQWHQRCSKHIS